VNLLLSRTSPNYRHPGFAEFNGEFFNEFGQRNSAANRKLFGITVDIPAMSAIELPFLWIEQNNGPEVIFDVAG